MHIGKKISKVYQTNQKKLQVVFRYSEGSTEEMLCRITKCTKQPFPFNMPGFHLPQFHSLITVAFEGSMTEQSVSLTGGFSTSP